MSTADINRRVLPGATQSSRVELLAVGSRDQSRADEFAHEWGIERAYGSYEALLEDPDVEAVYIPLPNTLHAEWSIRALEAGKHVLCEKPLSRHVEEVAAMFDAAERTGRHLSEAFMYRHHPQTKRLTELVQEGAIGQLRLIRSTFSYSLYDENNIRLRADLEGGGLMDVGCYCLSGSRLLAGEPAQVSAMAWFGPTGTDWTFTATMRFADDVLALFDCGTALVERDELEAVGSEGTLFLDDPWHCNVPVIELRRDGRIERIEIEPVSPYKLEFENMSEAIRGESQLRLAHDDAIAQARALEALYESAVAAQPIAL
jgi:predicted dehydrogenase